MSKHLDYNQPLTDREKHLCSPYVKPHPDGQPHTKCCRTDDNNKHGCAFINEYGYDGKDSDKSRAESFPHLFTGEVRFFCIHQPDADGYHRICAGWDAITRGLEIKENKNKS